MTLARALARAMSALAKAAAASYWAAERGGTVLLREGREGMAEARERWLRAGGEGGGGVGCLGSRGGEEGAAVSVLARSIVGGAEGA
jgi:hypothetical protein